MKLIENGISDFFSRLVIGISIPVIMADSSNVFLNLFKVSLSFEIVDQSGGLVWFRTEENKGTAFYVVFPKSGMKEKKGEKKLD